MRRSAVPGLAIAAAILFGWVIGGTSAAAGVPDATTSQGETVLATPDLVRQLQFMLQTIGLDPGPIDGNARALTNRAAHQFQLLNGLPISDIANGGQISAAFVELLRKQAIVKLGGGAAPAAQPSVPTPSPAQTPPAPQPASAPPATPPPAIDRFASCNFSPEDFQIGGERFTPQSFLDQGFDGSTDRAVSNLEQRLKEARDIAEKIGGSALLEVQRQARVLAYFECRQKIEQAAAAPK